MSPAEKIKETHYSEKEAAEAMGVSIPSLRTYRSDGRDHPPYRKVGRATWYPKNEFHAWINKRPVVRAIT